MTSGKIRKWLTALPPPPPVDITYKDIGAYSGNINIRRVAETQMVSVRKRNIQGRNNSVQHLQRLYPELPPLRVVSIVTSSVPISLENTNTTRTRLRLYTWKQDICAKLKVINHVPALSSHNSVTVNSVGVNTKNKKKTGKKTGKNATRFCWCLHDLAKQISTPRYVIILIHTYIYIYIYREGNGLRPTSLFKSRVSALIMKN